jgi:hypothetical protein
MSEYITPSNYFFRIHHVRPRFKGNPEDVLLYMATEIAKIDECDSHTFRDTLNNAVKLYPGNSAKSIKTINNWRTEISSLFAFYIETAKGTAKAGQRALELAENQDLVEMFKKFLFLFQYPGAHVKSGQVLEMINMGIKFKPAQYILKVLQAGETDTNVRAFLTKEETCHCIFNDLRCTRDNDDPLNTWRRIVSNRQSKMTYNRTGDVIRYAGDIIDYMEKANLLVTHDGNRFYLNNLEHAVIMKFINSEEWFNRYDAMIEHREANFSAINHERERWFHYANRTIDDTDFATDLIAFIAADEHEYTFLKEASVQAFQYAIEDDRDSISIKDIGDMGEGLVFVHEQQRVKTGGRKDLIHLITKIPTALALGFDIQSIELDERKRYIEVKTTISSQPLQLNRIHLTTNEWRAAETMKDRYFVYRLVLNKTERKLFIIQDPVGLYKHDIIQMVPREGADITFGKNAGEEEALLSWVN